MISLQRRCKKHRQSQVFSIRAGLTFEKINPEVLFYGTSGRKFMLFGVLPDSNKYQYIYQYCKREADKHNVSSASLTFPMFSNRQEVQLDRYAILDFFYFKGILSIRR